MTDRLVVIPSDKPYFDPALAKPGRHIGKLKNSHAEVPLIYADGQWIRPRGIGGHSSIKIEDIESVRIGDWEIG